jgi:hypothetical protein
MSIFNREEPQGYLSNSGNIVTKEIKNQLYQCNDNNGLLADILHRGILSGDFKLSDDIVRSTILSLTNSTVLVNNDIHRITKYSNIANCMFPSNGIIGGVKDCNKNDDSTSSLTNSVHIQDVTDDNSDKAQELSSHHRVSWIGEVVNEVVDITDSSNSKKRSRNTTQSRIVRGKNKKKATNKSPQNDRSVLTSFDEVISYMSLNNQMVSSFITKYKNLGKYQLFHM